MPVHTATVFFLVLLSGRAVPPPAAPPHIDLLAGASTISLTLEAPLQQLFEKGSADEKYRVPGTLSYKDPSSGAGVILKDVQVSVRGHTSREETECTFPKLKLKFHDGGALRIGTHCGEATGETLSAKYGRLPNEKSPLREALVYRLLQAVAVPTLRTRPARVTYIDPSSGSGSPLVRDALLVEDDDDAKTRVKGTAEIPMESFGNVRTRGASADAGRIVFGEAMIGNFDWCLKFAPDDIYRCDELKPLWNVLAYERADGTDGKTALVMKDFDLAGIVVGRHLWLKTIFNPAFVPSRSEIEIEVLAQVQRARALFPRAELDAVRRSFMGRKAAAYAVLEKADVDTHGRETARTYLDTFFKAIGDDDTFYRPVVAGTDVRVYADAARGKEACGPKDVMRAGTPVNELQKSGAMSQVIVLDAMWRWGQKDACDAIRTGPVWIPSDAITKNFPR